MRSLHVELIRLMTLGVLALLFAACSSAPSDGERSVVTATLNDDMTIQLSRTQFVAGESVRFDVTNAGSAQHEFVLGDEEEQESHAGEMAEMEGDHGDSFGITLDPGASASVEYTFDGVGEVLAACHVSGHYEAGMFERLSIIDG